MLIGELSKQTGLTKDAIRFYEKKGLISLGRTDRRLNNYKEYPEETVRRLLLVKKIKSYGFTLNESAEIINLVDARLDSCKNIADMAEDKISAIDLKINELIALKTLLKNSMASCLSGNEADPADRKCSLLDL